MDIGQLQKQRIEQKVTLTQGMKQSLDMLQMALPDLKAYIEDQALSNPLIELGDSPAVEEDAPSFDGLIPVSVHCRDERIMNGAEQQNGKTEPPWPEPGQHTGSGEDFIDHLNEQLIGMKRLDAHMRGLCRYLIFCLNERGYLEFDLQEIARELRVPLFEMEQALYIVQSLEPAGVGARTLQECLILQLMQGRDFSALTLHAVQKGLELISKNNMQGLARKLGCSLTEAKAAAEVIRSLSPIPSQGYGNERAVQYQIPEATVRIERGRLILELNRSFLPRVACSREITELLQKSQDPKNQEYLRKNTLAANQLIRCLDNRQSTMERLLLAVLKRQHDYFLRGDALLPMTMGEIAEELELNASTISRAVREKTILFKGRLISLRDLFTARLAGSMEENISGDAVRQQLVKLIRAEDPSKPLSDEELRAALLTLQLKVSRRTIAKYREELDIPGSAARRRSKQYMERE